MSPKQKPTLLFVFAHPDDDAFGPSGSLIKLSREYDVYFLCATKGESGQNHAQKSSAPLSEIRAEEVLESARIIGAKDVFFLGFIDGNLCNNNYHQLADTVQTYIDRLRPEVLLTWEPRGVSGHIDHMVVSSVCHYVFYRSPSIRKLMLYCLSEYQTSQFLEGYFVYRPPGYKQEEIDVVYDTSDVWEQKVKAMKCHNSQIKDFERIMKRPKVRLMEDCYQIITKA